MRGTFRLLLVWIGRRLRLESLRNRLADFLEKVADRVGVYASALKKNSAATGNETQRERIKRLFRFSAFNVKARFSVRIGV